MNKVSWPKPPKQLWFWMNGERVVAAYQSEEQLHKNAGRRGYRPKVLKATITYEGYEWPT